MTRAARCGWPRCRSTRAGSASGITRLEERSGGRVAFLTRLGEGLLPTVDTVLQDGDIVHVVMREETADSVESVLRQHSPEGT